CAADGRLLHILSKSILVPVWNWRNVGHLSADLPPGLSHGHYVGGSRGWTCLELRPGGLDSRNAFGDVRRRVAGFLLRSLHFFILVVGNRMVNDRVGRSL